MPLNTLDAQALSRRALEAAENFYSPYSRFRVGAAVLLENGEIVTGTNVENASYRLTTCAEQAAIVAAVSRFGPACQVSSESDVVDFCVALAYAFVTPGAS